MITDFDIPMGWRKVRAAIAKEAPRGCVVLGGGALRDLDNDRPVKDLDFFVPAQTQGELESLLFALELEHDVLFKPAFTSRIAPRAATAETLAAYTAQWPVEGGFYEVQIIGLKFPAGDMFLGDVLTRMDIGLCQIAWDGKRVSFTSRYMADKGGKVLTTVYAPTEIALRRSKKRAARLLEEKYQGWGYENISVQTQGAGWAGMYADEQEITT